MKRFFKIFLLTLLGFILAAFAYILITFPPVMAGMAAKTMCSCVFVTGRDPQSVRDKELQVFPGLSSSTILVHEDSTVTATVFWKTSKAIFRKGLGCTLLAQRSEEDVRAQQIVIAGTVPTNQDSIAWPAGNVTTDSILPEINNDMVRAAIDEAFFETDPERPLNTHAVVVVYNNSIIGERYAKGFDENSRLMGWSMTKSITNALLGILVQEGKLDIQQPAPVSEWKDDNRSKITLSHLLQASSGLAWSESYFSPTADFHQMFIKSDDKGGYALSKKLKHEPGTHFQYSSGTTNILSKIIRQTVGDSAYYQFPYQKLFYKIGMNHAIMEPDASGSFVASSYSFATARDWARFGLLFLNDGVWNGERILPEGWVKYSVTPAPGAEIGQYGAHWWLNAGDRANTPVRKFPDLPTDAYWADGFEEQTVMIIPSKQLVIVRLGVSHHGFDFSKLARGIIAALPN
ncbi:serine hydrolase [Chryseolinea sp. H1M3-3]|uniref:serine hydrolase domain-containing protein n=1 Tax=Chryseolinea sp. H1M3-3 TaxID=3034144 RepID=UPI0023EBDFAD|nr:serine hydrolase [Chryseolinea sp. H1M3-3]